MKPNYQKRAFVWRLFIVSIKFIYFSVKRFVYQNVGKNCRGTTAIKVSAKFIYNLALILSYIFNVCDSNR
jgi:hypothetical protein